MTFGIPPRNHHADPQIRRLANAIRRVGIAGVAPDGGITTDTSNQLKLKLDGGTLETSSAGVKVNEFNLFVQMAMNAYRC